jgi:hypothetical protein
LSTPYSLEEAVGEAAPTLPPRQQVEEEEPEQSLPVGFQPETQSLLGPVVLEGRLQLVATVEFLTTQV